MGLMRTPKKQEILGVWVHETGFMVTLFSVVLLCVSVSFCTSPGENSLQGCLVAATFRSHNIPVSLRNFQRVCKKAGKN